MLSKNTTVPPSMNGSRRATSSCAETLVAGPRLRPVIRINWPGATKLGTGGTEAGGNAATARTELMPIAAAFAGSIFETKAELPLAPAR